jgi:DNA-binding transcriptional LysR family regulator
MLSDAISLRGLEIFDAVVRTGSAANAAEALGLSVGTVSQQLRKLEEGYGVDLFDHARRPLKLTPAGERFRRRAEAALGQMRLLQLEVKAYDLSALSSLHVGVIDDFDYRITPRVATALANAVADCSFLLQTRASLQLYDLVSAGRVDFAVAASPTKPLPNVVELPLVEDPFVLIVPKGTVVGSPNWQESLAHLPFLRIDRNLRIAETIDFELRQRNLDLASRFEFDSMTTINTLVSSGRGWAITSVLSLLQSEQILTTVDCHDLPFGSFSRTISGLAASHTAESAAQELANLFRNAVDEVLVAPVTQELPWLRDRFRVLES